MLKNKTKIITIFLTLILLFSTTFVLADNEISDNGTNSTNAEPTQTKTSTENEAINSTQQQDSYKKSDVYLTGDNVTIDYIVDGNLFVCANTVTINSQIGGDAFIMAKNLIVEKDAYIFSNLFSMTNSTEIKGVAYDVYALSKDFTISGGYVYRDLKISCDTLNINGIIGRNAFANCSNINFNTDENTNGVIYGNLDYKAKSEISIPENAVNGEVKYSKDSDFSNSSIQSIIADYILNLGEFLAFVLIIWLVCLWLTPKFLNNTNKFIGKKTPMILGYGLLSLILIPIVCIILILLRLTSNVSLLLLALYILAVVISKSLFTITANNYVCSKLNINKNTGILGMLIASSTVVWILSNLPYVGALVSFITSVFGLGILVNSIIPIKNKVEEKNIKNKN